MGQHPPSASVFDCVVGIYSADDMAVAPAVDGCQKDFCRLNSLFSARKFRNRIKSATIDFFVDCRLVIEFNTRLFAGLPR